MMRAMVGGRTEIDGLAVDCGMTRIYAGDNNFFFSSRRRHTSWNCDWSSDVCSSDLSNIVGRPMALELLLARATVTVCHTGTRELRAEVERAELLDRKSVV